MNSIFATEPKVCYMCDWRGWGSSKVENHFYCVRQKGFVSADSFCHQFTPRRFPLPVSCPQVDLMLATQ